MVTTSKVATVYSVINSAEIVNLNSNKNGFKGIVDAVKEWDEFKDTINRKIGLINLNNNSKFSSMKRKVS